MRRPRTACNPCSRPRPPHRPSPLRSRPRRHGRRSAPSFPAQARQFARANGFAAKPGACLTLPSADGKIAQVLFGLEDEASKSRDLFRPGSLPGLLPPGVYRFANAPHDTPPRRAGLCARQLSLQPLPQERCAQRQAGAARWRRHRRYHADGGSGHACPRSHQYALERHGTGRAGARRRATRKTLRRQFQLHRRRRSDAAEFSADSCGRHGVDRARRG